MAKRLEAGVAVTPLGIGQPPAFALIYERAGASAFGQSQTLICPHFVDEGGGRCGIWEHRGEVCGEWLGREAEFYQECSRLVAGLRWQDVLAVGGSEVQLFARLACDAYRKLTSDEIPDRLKVGTFQIVRMDQDSRRVVSYSGMDPLDLPKVLVDVLPYFDGRPTNQAIKDVAASESVNLHPDLVRKLSDFEVLVPCDGSTPEAKQHRVEDHG